MVEQIFYVTYAEMILRAGANVYYAVNTQHELIFVLRKRRHGDERVRRGRWPETDAAEEALWLVEQVWEALWLVGSVSDALWLVKITEKMYIGYRKADSSRHDGVVTREASGLFCNIRSINQIILA